MKNVLWKEGSSMWCVNCGDELISGSLFCANCGARVAAPAGLDNNRQAPQNKGLIVALITLLVVIIAGGAVYSMASWLKGSHTDESTTRRTSEKTAAETKQSGETSKKTDNSEQTVADENIIGLWSSEGPSGEMVDPDTGYATGSIYNGSWYLFRDDGTYRYVIVGSGQIISGGVVCEGNVSVGNGKILLTDVRESWYPDLAVKGQMKAYEDKSVADSALTYRYEDQKDILVINDFDFYHRVKE